MEGLSDAEKEVVKEFQRINAEASKMGAAVSEPAQKASGLINELKQRIVDLEGARDRSFQPVAIERFNAKIREAQAQIAKLTDTTAKQAPATEKATGAVIKLREQIQQLEKARDRSFDTKEIEQYNLKIRDAQQQLRGLTTVTEREVPKQESLFKSIGGVIAAYFSVQALVEFGKKVIEVTSQFQKFEAVLTNTLGSNSAAQRALASIQAYAVQSNRSVAELTDSYVKFANRGIRLTTDEIRKLDDLANSTGKSFDQLTEAALDAFSGENERLKEFGIQAKKTGETTQFTFKGVTTEVKNNQAAIKEYITSLGDLQGVAGSTAAISQTLEGRISNLGDSFDQLFLAIGKGASGPFTYLLGLFNDYIQFVTNAIKSTEDFQNEIANIQADKYVKQFAAYSEAEQILAEDRLRKAIAAQDELLRIEREGREARQAQANEAAKQASKFGALVVAAEIAKSEREVQLEQDRLTNQKRLDVIKEFYAEQRKLAEQAANTPALGLLEGLEKKLKELGEAQKKAFSAEEIKKYEEEIINTQNEIEELKKVLRGQGVDDRALIKGGATEELIKSIDEQTRAAKGGEDELFDIAEEGTAKRVDLSQSYYKTQEEFAKLAGEKDLERLAEVEERRRAIMEETYNFGRNLADAAFEISRNNTQADLDNLEAKKEQELKLVGDNEQAKAFIQAKFDRQQAALKNKQAKQDRDEALFNIVIDTATSIIRTGAQLGYPAAIPFVALAAAAGAVQAAVVLSRPLPKYKDGVLDIDGPGTSTSDSILARLSKGESVMTARETQDYRPVLEAIRGGFDPDMLNNMVINYDHLGKLASIAYRPQQIDQKALEMVMSKAVQKAVSKLPISSVQMDEKGFKKFILTGDSVTEVLNNQFPQ